MVTAALTSGSTPTPPSQADTSSSQNLRPERRIWSGAEVVLTPLPQIGFLVDKLIPRTGIVLLYGKYGSYKTPLTVHLASCIAQGQAFFDLPTTQAKVLYIEGDTPRLGLWPRLQRMNVNTSSLDFAFIYPGFDITNPGTGMDNISTCKLLAEQFHNNQYSLVIVDSLRTSHRLTGKDDEVPSLVYGSLASWFPGAVVLVVHHDRKTRAPEGSRYFSHSDSEEETDAESFSGSQAWIDRATTAIKLRKGYGSSREWITLVQTKSQVGEMIEPLQLHVTDGCQFRLTPNVTEGAFTQALMQIGNAWRNKADLDLRLSAILGIPDRMVKPMRIAYERVHPITKP